MKVSSRTGRLSRSLASSARRGVAAGSTRLESDAPTIPPLLPILLPVVIAAILSGVFFAWWFPPVAPGGVAPIARFTDVTDQSGLNVAAETADPAAPTSLGGGVVAFDYDGDGHPDLFFVNGAPWPWEETLSKRATRGSCTLFHNDGAGHFTDVTAIAGLNVELQGMSAAAGDFDNDGLPDLYVTCVGTNHLFHNRGNGRFEDVTEAAGVGGEDNTWSTGAVWMDIDGDGRLDLVVGHYARWPREVDLRMAFTVANVGRSYGAPTGFVGAFPSVYRNLGDGHFAVVAGSAGLRDIDPQTGFPVAKTLAIVPVDVNGDGKLDLLFTYHTSESALFLNQGDGTFRRWAAGLDQRQEGVSAGLASLGSLPMAGRNARFAALQAALALAGHRHNDAFADLRSKLAVALLDYDLDGRLDLFSGGGRAEPDTNRFENGRDFSAAPELRWNRGDGWVAASAGPNGETWARPIVARGIAAADFDGDGDIDIVIAQNAGPPRLLRNDQRSGSPWLQIDLVAKRGARAADGAQVEVYTPRGMQVQTMAPAMGYMAQSAATLTFGLGDDARVRKIVVHWPDGVRQELRAPSVNRRLVIREP